jgi:hypothetical protein
MSINELDWNTTQSKINNAIWYKSKNRTMSLVISIIRYETDNNIWKITSNATDVATKNALKLEMDKL